MKLKFMHASDLHLGAAFSGMTNVSKQLGEKLTDAVLAAFDNLIATCLSSGIDFLLLAGDTFDEGKIPFRAYRHLSDGLLKLKEAGIEVYLCTGNHDPLDEWPSIYRKLPDNVHIFPAGQVNSFVFSKDGNELADIYSVSYGKNAVEEDFAVQLKHFRSAHPSSAPFDICMLHTGMEDRRYAPCSLDELRSLHADYCALGHIHKRAVLNEDPPIAYAGSPQGLDINDCSQHGCFLVTLDSDGSAKLEEVSCEVYHWAKLEIDIASATSLDDAMELIVAALDAIVHLPTVIGTVVRIRLRGRCEMYSKLDSPDILDQLATEIHVKRPNIFIDKIENFTRPPIDIFALQENKAMFPSAFISQARQEREHLDNLKTFLVDALRQQEIDYVPGEEELESLLERAMYQGLDALVEGDR